MFGEKAACPDGLFVPAVFRETDFYLNSLIFVQRFVQDRSGSNSLSRYSWPSPPNFSTYRHIFVSLFPPFWVSLSVLCARKLLLRKSLFLDQNFNQIDSIIPHNFHFARCLLHWMGGSGGGGGKVVVAVAVASVVLVVQKGLHRHHLMGLRQ
jgi:hypothetical protein